MAKRGRKKGSKNKAKKFAIAEYNKLSKKLSRIRDIARSTVSGPGRS